jgi:zinc transporter 2
MTCGIGCGFSGGGNHVADARKQSTSIRKIWTIVILYMVFISVEVVGGIKTSSLEILTDATHL